MEYTKLKAGISGIMRVKNDAEFVEACIDSCIEALDELIIVYNDCSDNSPELIKKKQKEYPTKIKVFEYKHKVYSISLTEEEYKYALNLSDDSPNLLCNYYNFALSKANYQYAIKIDADQLYFKDELNKWRKICRDEHYNSSKFYYGIGYLVNIYYILYKFLSFKFQRRLQIIPSKIVESLKPYYESYAAQELKKGNACISLSGVNVFKMQEWFVTMGKENDIFNIMPPFNGEGDHLIFKISPSTYYKKYDMPYYNKLRNFNYSLIEEFVHPYKTLCWGFAWFHLNSMRKDYRELITKVKQEHEEAFIDIKEFSSFTYREIEERMDKVMTNNRQKTIFALTYKNSSNTILKHLPILTNYRTNE